MDPSTKRFIFASSLVGHTEEITCLGVARGSEIPGDSDIIATASSDGTIRVCRLSADKYECIQVIDVGKKYALALEIAFLPGTSIPIIFAAGTDKMITLYVFQSGSVCYLFILIGDSLKRLLVFRDIVHGSIPYQLRHSMAFLINSIKVIWFLPADPRINLFEFGRLLWLIVKMAVEPKREYCLR